MNQRQSPLDIGSRRELFVDHRLIAQMRGGAALRLQHPVPREVAFPIDRPWEVGGYITVFRDGDRYRMYYKGITLDENSGMEAAAFGTDDVIVCYAESADGIQWERPSLGLFEFRGSRENNIIWMGKGSHGFAPFQDPRPDCPPEERYKAFGRSRYRDPSAEVEDRHWAMLFLLTSPDGLRWKLKEGPKGHGSILDRTDGHFDSQNVGFWDDAIGAYRLYVRVKPRRRMAGWPETARERGIREIHTTTSRDALHWPKPEPLLYPGAPDEELYTNQVIPYFRAPHIYLGFPVRYMESRGALTDWHRKMEQVRPGRYYTSYTDGLFMSSRDGRTFHRWGEAFLRPGMPEESRWGYGECYQGWGLVETRAEIAGAPDELSLYITDGKRSHADACMRRYTLRADGFTSINAPLAGGELITHPLVFQGSRLLLNMSTSAAGSVRVEMQDADGKALTGFALEDCPEYFGNTLERDIRWNNAATPLPAGRPVRLRFVLKDADLFAFRFA